MGSRRLIDLEMRNRPNRVISYMLNNMEMGTTFEALLCGPM